MIKFLCAEDDVGKIPEPYPARKLMPEWFKNLSTRVDQSNPSHDENATIKRCPPFLDAMCAGWIIPLAGDVEITSSSGAEGVNWKSNHHKTLIEQHTQAQVANNPNTPKPPLKFLNWWMMKVPVGYSILFVPPLNRPDFRFQCISGLVDDGYMGNGALEYINFPFFFTATNYSGIIKAGTPLVQAIPIKRDEVLLSSRSIDIGVLSAEDLKLNEDTRERRKAHVSLYRDTIWERK